MAKKLWGTRFTKGSSALTDKFTSSISYDKRLAKYDILGSIAHAKMLGKSGIIKLSDAKSIIRGLNSILRDIENNKFKYDMQAEDIHSNIAEALKKKIGSPADKLHTARSRNDQIVLDVKMYCKDKINDLSGLVRSLQKAILGFAARNSNTVIPAYTHMQMAQCVLLAHHLLAYVEFLERDEGRLADTFKRTDSMPLGSCALSGTGLPIDREYTRKLLGFGKATANSIDSVSDRDFIIELLADISILSMHLSRIAEDLILWSTKEFNFIDIDFSFCTGSSIMPHKKNPDVLELIRGSVGKIYGDLNSVLILMKGLPLSYNRDLQLDKPALFNGIDTISDILVIFIELFKNIKINNEAVAAKLVDESLFSVDIVEYLVEKGLSYRQAHDITGKMVRQTLDKNKKISDLTLAELKKYSPVFDLKIRGILKAWASVSRKTSYGGTSPRLVNMQLKKWKGKLNA